MVKFRKLLSNKRMIVDEQNWSIFLIHRMISSRNIWLRKYSFWNAMTDNIWDRSIRNGVLLSKIWYFLNRISHYILNFQRRILTMKVKYATYVITVLFIVYVLLYWLVWKFSYIFSMHQLFLSMLKVYNNKI